MPIRFRPDVIELKPKVVVILAGTNDIAGNTGPATLDAIEDNIRSMVELARQNGIRVVLASLLPVSDYEQRDGKQIVQTVRRPPEKIKALNQQLKELARAMDLVYLDYFTAVVDEKGFLKDELSAHGLHGRNSEGVATDRGDKLNPRVRQKAPGERLVFISTLPLPVATPSELRLDSLLCIFVSQGCQSATLG